MEGIYRRPIKDKVGNITRYKFEPRFTPSSATFPDGTTQRFQRLALGEYSTPAKAKIVLQIARFYYGQDGDCVELEDSRYKLPIPTISELEQGFIDEEKREWVTSHAKQVGRQMYAEMEKAKDEQMVVAIEVGSHASVGHGKDYFGALHGLEGIFAGLHDLPVHQKIMLWQQ